MTSVRWFVVICVLFLAALGVSGVLYQRSQLADFSRHAQAVEALGKVGHYQELLTEQVLAARFGLLNQYDPITSAELNLTSAAVALPGRLAQAVRIDGELSPALDRLQASAGYQRAAAENFKTGYSVLKNSAYFLPTAADELHAALDASPKPGPPNRLSQAIRHLVEETLKYELIGDQAASQRQAQALSILAAQRSHVPPALTQQFDLLLAHASLIGRKQASVDQLVKQVVDRDVGEQLRTVEREYQRRFDQTVQSSNKYRRILYGWSLGLLVAIGFAGFWLLRLYTSLERRVAERTADLKQALDALWGEMKLARKIQEALVPKAPVGRNCEIAASMRPTDEVGGDYYDVVRARDRDWILIGDVSGHGVPAGLIMMMCHTAVRTVLGADPDISPDRLLSTVNTVLTQNIRQLGEDKYMTISAFRRDPDGTVLFAGAHQDVHIYRADTDHVESLETQGIWLGIREDVRDSLVNQKFHLRPGDLMVLYTDGISEARRGETMFDTTGVNQVLTQAKGKSAEQVLDELFAGLDGYQVTDDATVLVIKQLASDQPDLHVGSVTSAA